MKKALAFLVLLSHMNTSMLLPQVPEQDHYDTNGRRLDDINSVVEYIQVALGNDTTPDDEDDDNGQTFHLVKAVDYIFSQPHSIVQEKKPAGRNTNHFPEYRSGKIEMIAIDIVTPPPEA
ncbi:MAG TPA: hypothetical protein VK563_13235 [Puia sp.]|nr:hypothetical protein [Puia sp.]